MLIRCCSFSSYLLRALYRFKLRSGQSGYQALFCACICVANIFHHEKVPDSGWHFGGYGSKNCLRLCTLTTETYAPHNVDKGTQGKIKHKT